MAASIKIISGGTIMIKKWLCCALIVVFMVALFAGCNNSGNGNSSKGNDAGIDAGTNEINFDEDPFKITFMTIITSDGAGLDDVEKAISEAALRDINMTIDIVPTSFGNHNQQVQLALSSGEPLDVLMMFGNNAPTYIDSGYLIDMGPLLDQYGQGIIEQLGEDVAYAASMNNFVFLTTGFKEYCYPYGLNMRADICDELGIDPDAVKTLDDLDAVFATVRGAYPNMDILVSGLMRFTTTDNIDALTDNFGVLMDPANNTTVTNRYGSDSYYEQAQKIRQWYNDGYVKKDMAITTETGEAIVMAGNAFSFFSLFKPNTAVEKKSQTGYDMYQAWLGASTMSTGTISGIGYAIANNTKDPVKAMQCLNWMYTSSEFMNLIDWGIEGRDYQYIDKENNIIDYVDGQDYQTVAYHVDLGWALPNQSIAALWVGNEPDVWEQYRAFNDAATRSLAMGFTYDPTPVINQVANVAAVVEEYEKPIYCGTVDPETAIPAFLEALENAGINDIIAEKQRQLDEFLASQ